jgi:Lar family restriction alleviation protein
MSQLKPCPFCGGEAVTMVEDGVRVICLNCGCQTKSLMDIIFGGEKQGDAVQRSVDTWNQRVNTTKFDKGLKVKKKES